MKMRDNLKSGCVRIEIQGMHPENVVNGLWTENIKIENLERINITTLRLDIDMRYLPKARSLAGMRRCKVKVIGAKGMLKIFLRIRNGGTLTVGAIIFIAVIYFLSMHVWNIEIDNTSVISPYEIRQKLLSYGVKPGILKSSVNIYNLENKLKKSDDRIMWARVRIEGGTLKVKIEEKQNPPLIKQRAENGDMVAKMDGEIVRLYTTSGTARVKQGDIVKKGQVLIQGIQGKEGFTYETPSEGTVIARTFYEDSRKVQINGIRDIKTGDEKSDIYLKIFGQKLYLKKDNVEYKKYDKIEESGKVINKTIYRELKEEEYNLDIDEVINEEKEAMEEELIKNLDKTAKIVDRIIDYKLDGQNLNVRSVFIVEQDIAENPD